MSKDSGGSQTVTQKIDPEMKAAYLQNLEQAKSVAGNLGVQKFAGFNPMYQQGEKRLVNIGLTPFTGKDIRQFMNPYEKQVIQGALGDIEQSRLMAANQTANAATAAKAFGGSRYGVQQSLTDQAALQQAAKTAAQMRMEGYAAATQTAMNARNLGLQGAQLVMGAGGARQQLEQARLDAARNIGLQRLGVVQSALSGQPANLGGTTSQPTYRNQAAGALGGALAGAQLGSIVPGIGTGIGAGIGGLIGLLG